MTFLQYVAKDIIAKHGAGNLADVAVVFPNKRASLFLNRALYEEAGKPVWSPAYFTISDLFRHHSILSVPDQISLVFRLYNIYTEITGSKEPLDHFFSWGQLMLSDFDDIDKNLVDADKLFINLEAWQEMKDFSFLSENQRKSLEQFFGKMLEQTQLQQQFNDTWKHLGNIYHAFRKSLLTEGLAYEGMLYRQVVEQGIGDLQYRHYIFVGFNLLQKVEQQLFMQLKNQGLAQFYWDYDRYYMKPENEAGRFIQQYLTRFPNELSEGRASVGIDTSEIYDNFSGKATDKEIGRKSTNKNICYVSAPTEDIQARYVTTWLRERLAKREESKKAESIAIVLADEHLLQNVIHAIPKEAGDVNITTGYPLTASPAATLVDNLLGLQLYGLTKDGSHFRLQHVNRILRHPYAKFITNLSQQVYEKINSRKTYFPSVDLLTEDTDEAMTTVFQPLKATGGVIPLLPWIASVLKFAGIGARDCGDVLTHESIFRMYTLVQRLNDIMTVSSSDQNGVKEGKQLVSTNVLQRLLNQVMEATSIPFHGEPARGIQVMGVLETRNLDFDHVLLLSANEGNIPRGVNDASFIPHSLRMGYEMTTIENKVAIYSYYFHSLIQRAKDITMTYNTSAENGSKGEMSRFMLQYMVENNGKDIRLLTLRSGQSLADKSLQIVEKTGRVAEKLNAITHLSPTAIGRYLRCNLQFYYYSVCGLKEQDDNDEDEIDNAVFGNIFHRTAELIYTYLSGENHATRIEKSMIEALLKDQRKVNEFLDQAFREKLFKVDDPSFHPTYNGLQLLNRKVIHLYINRLLRYDMRHTPFRILALEEDFRDNIELEANGEKRTIRLGGQIDRLDMIENLRTEDGVPTNLVGKPMVRVVDYKTGSGLGNKPNDIPSVSDIFDPQFVSSKHSAYYLQTFLYASIVRNGKGNKLPVAFQGLPVAPALLFIRVAGKEDYNPILRIVDSESNKPVQVNDINDVYEEYISKLKALMTEILNLDTPFEPTTDIKRCDNCSYKSLCRS